MHDETGTNSLPRRSGNRNARLKVRRSVSDAGNRRPSDRKPLDRKPEEKKTISIFATLDRLRHGNKKKQSPYYSGSKSDIEIKNVANRNRAYSAEPSGDVIDYSNSNYASNPRSYTDNPSPAVAPRRKKKQLSPIIEISPRDDYFEAPLAKTREYNLGGGEHESLNRKNRDDLKPIVKKQVYNSGGGNYKSSLAKNRGGETRGFGAPEKKTVGYDLGGGDYESLKRKARSSSFPKRERHESYTPRLKDTGGYKEAGNKSKLARVSDDESDIGANDLATPSATRGPTIKKLIRKLTEERRRSISPPKVTKPPFLKPDEGHRHNDNKPFSYTEPLPIPPPTSTTDGAGASAEDPADGGQVIYAQVVPSSNAGAAKQTIHTTVSSNRALGEDSREFATGVKRVTTPSNIMGQDRKLNGSNGVRIIPNRQKLFDETLPEEKILNMIRAQSKPIPLENDFIFEESKTTNTKFGTNKPIRGDKDIYSYGLRGSADGMELSERRNSSYEGFALGRKSSLDDGKDDLTLFREKYGHLYNKRSPSLNENDIGFSPARNLSHRRNLLESKIEDKQRRLSLTAGHVNSNQKDDLHSSLNISDSNGIDLKNNRYIETKLTHEDVMHGRHSLKHKYVSDSGTELSDYRKESLNGVSEELEQPRAALTSSRIENKATATYHRKVVPIKSGVEDYPDSGVVRPPRSRLSSKSFSSRYTADEKRRRSESLPGPPTLVRHYSQHETNTFRRHPKVHVPAISAAEGKKKMTKMEKVKQFFGVNGKKKKQDYPEEVVHRYREYRDSDREDQPPPSEIRRRSSTQEYDSNPDYYSMRQRLATPSPRPPLETITSASNNHHSQQQQPHQQQRRISEDRDTWFKSLDRLTHKSKTKPSKTVSTLRPGAVSESSVNDDEVRIHRVTTPTPRRNSDDRTLRFSESEPEMKTLPKSRKYNTTDSSPDSNTEGESRGSSQKSVVYLHATTVGDIPGSKQLRGSALSNGRRAMSREELSSNNDPVSLTPHKRTLSRSISVLAPWRPKHYHESMEIDYSKDQGDGKPPKHPQSGRARGSSVIGSGGNRVSSKHDQENTLRKKQGNQKNIFGKLSGWNKTQDQSDDDRGNRKVKRHASNGTDLVFTGKRYDRDTYLGKSIDSFHDYKKDEKRNSFDHSSGNSVYNRSRKLSASTNTTDYPHSRRYSTDVSSDANSKVRVKSPTSSEYIIPVIRYDPDESDEGKRHVLVETLGKERISKQKEESSRSTSVPKSSKFSSGWFRPKHTKVT